MLELPQNRKFKDNSKIGCALVSLTQKAVNESEVSRIYWKYFPDVK